MKRTITLVFVGANVLLLLFAASISAAQDQGPESHGGHSVGELTPGHATGESMQSRGASNTDADEENWIAVAIVLAFASGNLFLAIRLGGFGIPDGNVIARPEHATNIR